MVERRQQGEEKMRHQRLYESVGGAYDTKVRDETPKELVFIIFVGFPHDCQVCSQVGGRMSPHRCRLSVDHAKDPLTSSRSARLFSQVSLIHHKP